MQVGNDVRLTEHSPVFGFSRRSSMIPKFIGYVPCLGPISGIPRIALALDCDECLSRTIASVSRGFIETLGGGPALLPVDCVVWLHRKWVGRRKVGPAPAVQVACRSMYKEILSYKEVKAIVRLLEKRPHTEYFEGNSHKIRQYFRRLKAVSDYLNHKPIQSEKDERIRQRFIEYLRGFLQYISEKGFNSFEVYHILRKVDLTMKGSLAHSYFLKNSS